jgi:hypothetical protein
MFYNLRFEAALRHLCSLRSEAMVMAAKHLPLTPDQLASALSSNKPTFWKKRGWSPRRAAIMTIASVIEKSKREPVADGVAAFLALALASHAVRNADDAELICAALEHGGEAEAHSDDGGPQAQSGKDDVVTVVFAQERMELVLETWKLMTLGVAVTPAWFAVVFGMMDCVGQTFGANRNLTEMAMRTALGEPEFSVCMDAGRRQALRTWVIAGGQMVEAAFVDRKKSLVDGMAATARLYAAEGKRRSEQD